MRHGLNVCLTLAAALAVFGASGVTADAKKKSGGEVQFRGDTISEGTILSFGTWEQDEEHSGKEKLEWRVLSTDPDGHRALLITDTCIEAMPWDMQDKAEEWEDSSLKQWLNTAFFTEAFTESEADRIKEDVFLLDQDQVEEFFEGKADRKVYPAPKLQPEKDEEEDGDEKEQEDADDDDADAIEYAISELTDTMFWWLSSVGSEEKCAQCVGAEGAIVTAGYNRMAPGFGVRPAVWVSLD